MLTPEPLPGKVPRASQAALQPSSIAEHSGDPLAMKLHASQQPSPYQAGPCATELAPADCPREHLDVVAMDQLGLEPPPPSTERALADRRREHLDAVVPDQLGPELPPPDTELTSADRHLDAVVLDQLGRELPLVECLVGVGVLQVICEAAHLSFRVGGGDRCERRAPAEDALTVAGQRRLRRRVVGWSAGGFHFQEPYFFING